MSILRAYIYEHFSIVCWTKATGRTGNERVAYGALGREVVARNTQRTPAVVP